MQAKPNDYVGNHRNQTLARVAENLYKSIQSGRYYALFERSGQQYRRSLKTTDRKLADRRLADLRSQIGNLRADPAMRIVGFVEYAKQWIGLHGALLKPKSKKRRVSAINALTPYFAKKRLRDIVKHDVEDWISKRLQEVNPRTVVLELETMKMIFKHAIEAGILLTNPAGTIKRPKGKKKKPVIPTREQFCRLIEELRKCDKRALPAIFLTEYLAYSGCRLSEATETLWENIDFKAKTILVTGGRGGTKSNRERTIPLFPALEQLLNRRQVELPVPAKSSDRVFPIKNAKTAMDNACNRAGLPKFNHHSLRHYFCSNAIEEGVDFLTISRWLGHVDATLVASTYGHLRDKHSDEMAQRMTFTAPLQVIDPPA